MVFKKTTFPSFHTWATCRCIQVSLYDISLWWGSSLYRHSHWAATAAAALVSWRSEGHCFQKGKRHEENQKGTVSGMGCPGRAFTTGLLAFCSACSHLKHNAIAQCLTKKKNLLSHLQRAVMTCTLNEQFHLGKKDKWISHYWSTERISLLLCLV